MESALRERPITNSRQLPQPGQKLWPVSNQPGFFLFIIFNWLKAAALLELSSLNSVQPLLPLHGLDTL